MESKQNNFIVTLLSVLLLISVFIAGFFAYQTQRLAKELRVMSDESKPTPVATQTPDPTADWKTYVDPAGFSFSYPNNLEIEKYSNKVIVRIDFPRIETVEGICPRYLAFSAINKDSIPKTTKDKYSCVYETKIENDNVFIESQYYEGQNDMNKRIISTLKFIDPVACTMEAKLCPDGSAVGRSGPKCEFVPCPTSKP